MITIETIRQVPQSGSEWVKAEAAKQALREVGKTRTPIYFNVADLEPVLAYKLREQRLRTEHLRAKWTDDLVRTVTGVAFSIVTEDKDLELRMRTAILMTLPGVGVPVASAILALADPGHYGIVDFRNWRQLFPKRPATLSINHYSAYMVEVRRLAVKLEWQAQRVDWCIWQHDLQLDQTLRNTNTTEKR